MSKSSSSRKPSEFNLPTLIGVAIACFVVGAIVGNFLLPGLLSEMASSRDQDNGLSPSVVFSRIQERGELVSASQDYNITDKVTDANQFFDWFEIPFTQNSFWYRYAGTIKAGVNLQTAVIEQDEADPYLIHITLGEPYIISNTPDMERTGVLEQNDAIFNSVDIEDADEFQAKCVKESEKEAIEGGLLEEARVYAENVITMMFDAAFGEGVYTIDFIWVEN